MCARWENGEARGGRGRGGWWQGCSNCACAWCGPALPLFSSSRFDYKYAQFSLGSSYEGSATCPTTHHLTEKEVSRYSATSFLYRSRSADLRSEWRLFRCDRRSAAGGSSRNPDGVDGDGIERPHCGTAGVRVTVATAGVLGLSFRLLGLRKRLQKWRGEWLCSCS